MVIRLHNSRGIDILLRIKYIMYANTTPSIQVRDRNVNIHINSNVLAQIQKMHVNLFFAHLMSGRHSIIAVPNSTLLEFFTDIAYVSDISKDPKFVIIEYIPRKIAEKIYMAQIEASDFGDESHIEKPKMKQVKDRNILEYALKQKIPVRQNTMDE